MTVYQLKAGGGGEGVTHVALQFLVTVAHNGRGQSAVRGRLQEYVL